MSHNNHNTSIELENDPIEAIFALNMGDFMTEHLISKDLLNKIDSSMKDKITRLKGQLKELISIYSLDNTLTLLGFDSENEYVIYNAIAKTITQMLDVDICRIYLTPEFIKNPESSEDLIQMGSSDPEYTEKANKTVLESFFNDETVCMEGPPVFLAVPLVNNWGSVGVICIENKSEREISPELINLLETTANLFITSIRLQKIMEQTEEAIGNENSTPSDLSHLRAELTASIGDLGDEQQRFVEALAKAVDEKKHSRENSKHVAELTKKLCEYLDLNEKTTDLIYYAALLRNIGQINISEEVFSSEDRPSQETWNKLQNHPNIGVNLLMKINFLSEVIPYVHYHKERWDGKGVPEGLAGMSIPLGARIVAVADAYQAMITEKPYRKPLSSQEVLAIMKEEAGTKWDPEMVNVLYEIMKLSGN